MWDEGEYKDEKTVIVWNTHSYSTDAYTLIVFMTCQGFSLLDCWAAHIRQTKGLFIYNTISLVTPQWQYARAWCALQKHCRLVIKRRFIVFDTVCYHWQQWVVIIFAIIILVIIVIVAIALFLFKHHHIFVQINRWRSRRLRTFTLLPWWLLLLCSYTRFTWNQKY